MPAYMHEARRTLQTRMLICRSSAFDNCFYWFEKSRVLLTADGFQHDTAVVQNEPSQLIEFYESFVEFRPQEVPMGELLQIFQQVNVFVLHECFFDDCS